MEGLEVTAWNACGRAASRLGLVALLLTGVAGCRASGASTSTPPATSAPGSTAAPTTGKPLVAIKVPEAAFRREAQSAPMPVYPPAAIAKKTVGVVVLQVLTTPEGKVSTVDVLEAPSPETGHAAADAVRQWTFAPLRIDGASEDRSVKGRLTFYFSLRGGTPRVLNPSDVTTKSPTHGVAEPTRELTTGELDSLRKNGDVVVLDVRERDVFAGGHLPGAINIPLGELATRAPIELKSSRHTVVVCQDAVLCSGAMNVLRAAGFGHVDALKPA